MRTTRRSLIGFWVLIGVLVFKFLYAFLAYQDLKNAPGDIKHAAEMYLFSAFEITVSVIVLIEAIIYWLLRYKIRNILWVRVHVWMLFFCFVLMPLVSIGIYFLARDLESQAYFALTVQVSQVRFYLFWILVPVAHIFFIASIVQSFNPIKETKNDKEPAGLFDEFID